MTVSGAKASHVDAPLHPIWIAVAILMLIVLVGFVFNWLGSIPSMQPDVGTPTAYALTTKNMRFEQEIIVVQAGDGGRLTLQNGDLYAHSFDIDALDIHVEMPANGRASVSLSGIETGRYTFYCAIPGHTEAGMVGELIVD